MEGWPGWVDLGGWLDRDKFCAPWSWTAIRSLISVLTGQLLWSNCRYQLPQTATGTSVSTECIVCCRTVMTFTLKKTITLRCLSETDISYQLTKTNIADIIHKSLSSVVIELVVTTTICWRRGMVANSRSQTTLHGRTRQMRQMFIAHRRRCSRENTVILFQFYFVLCEPM